MFYQQGEQAYQRRSTTLPQRPLGLERHIWRTCRREEPFLFVPLVTLSCHPSPLSLPTPSVHRSLLPASSLLLFSQDLVCFF